MFKSHVSRPNPSAQRNISQGVNIYDMEHRSIKRDSKPSDQMKGYISPNASQIGIKVYR